MRRGVQDFYFFRDENHNIFGVSLGWDFTAEHEFGIKEIIEAFGLDDRKNGIKAALVRRVPHDLHYIKKGKAALLAFKNLYGNTSDVLWHETDRELHLFRDETTAGAWSGRDFGIHTTDEEAKRFIKDLHLAFLELDVLITFAVKNDKNPFSRAGLTFIILSKFPKSARDEFEKMSKKIAKTK